MTQADAFLQAILAEPQDDAPRLIFADWLTDHGEAERAEFVRVQCELVTTNGCGKCSACAGHLSRVNGQCPRFALRCREQELLLSRQPGNSVGGASPNTRAAARYVWAGPVARLNDPNETGWTFRRGFVAEVTCTTDEWFAYGPAICAAQPVERVVLSDRKPLPYDHMMGPATAKDFVWWYSRIESQNMNPRRQNTLPKQLWELLPCQQIVNHWKHYPTEAAALDALSTAALAFAHTAP